MIYLYAITDGEREPPPVRGILDAPVELRSVAGLGVVVSITPRGPEPTRDAVLAHGSVVEAVASEADALLPARFQTEFRDEASLQRSILARRDGLRSALDHVRGCVEIGVRALEPEVRAAGSWETGTSYMAAGLRAEKDRERLVAELDRPLRRQARDVRRSPRSRPFMHHAAYLVPRALAGLFTDAVADFQARRPEVTVVCTGPWAPYSFADTAEATA